MAGSITITPSATDVSSTASDIAGVTATSSDNTKSSLLIQPGRSALVPSPSPSAQPPPSVSSVHDPTSGSSRTPTNTSKTSQPPAKKKARLTVAGTPNGTTSTTSLYDALSRRPLGATSNIELQSDSQSRSVISKAVKLEYVHTTGTSESPHRLQQQVCSLTCYITRMSCL